MKKSLLLIAMFAMVLNGFSQITDKPVAAENTSNLSKSSRTPVTELAYCNYDDVSYWWAIKNIMMYMPNDTMTKYAGGVIPSIGFSMDPSNVTSLKIAIWTDTSGFGANPAFEQVVDISKLNNGWNDIYLETPFDITGDSLFIGIIMEATGNAAYLNSTLHPSNCGDIYGDETGWDHAGVDWMLRAAVDDGNPYTDFALDLQTGTEYTMVPAFMLKKFDFSIKATNKGNKNAPTGHAITVKDDASTYTATAKTTKDLVDGETDSIGFDTQFFPALGKHNLTFTTVDDFDDENSTITTTIEITDTVMACDSRNDEKTGAASSFQAYQTSYGIELWYGNAFDIDVETDLSSVTFYCDAPTQSATVLRVYRLGADTAMIAQSDSINVQSSNEIKRTVIFPADSIADDYYKAGNLHLTVGSYFVVAYGEGGKALNLESSVDKPSTGRTFYPGGPKWFTDDANVLRLNFGAHGPASAVKTVANTSLSLYPNPTTGVINISEKASVSIYTLAGVKLADYNEVNTFDMSNLAKGAYIVKIKTNNAVVTKKVTLTK